jgi:hypothetical protein
MFYLCIISDYNANRIEFNGKIRLYTSFNTFYNRDDTYFLYTERVVQKVSEMYMPTDMQYKDNLRKDKFINDMIIEAIKSGNTEKALEYLEKNNERIEKALEE